VLGCALLALFVQANVIFPKVDVNRNKKKKSEEVKNVAESIIMTHRREE